MVSGDDKTTTWTSFNKPQVITDTLTSNESLFVYGSGIEFREARKDEVPDVTIAFKSLEGFTGLHDPADSTITLDPRKDYLSVVPHEVSHILGGEHLPNITGSIKSYAPNARKEFTEEEMKDVVDAYR